MSDELVKLVLDDADEKMDKAVAHARTEFAGDPHRPGRPRAGREAHGRLLRHRGAAAAARRVPGARGPPARDHPLRQGRRSAPSRRRIQHSDLGLNPSNDGQVIRLTLPAAHRRAPQGAGEGREAHGRGGPGRGAQPAPGGPPRPRGLEKDGDVSEDELARAEKELDKLTHAHEAEIDKALEHKEAELLEV